MNEIEEEIQLLQDELDRKREEISDLKKLLGRDIDREFSVPVEELSDRELENYLRDQLSAFKAPPDARPDIRAFTSPRKTLGKPFVFLKRALLETTFTRLNVFLDQLGLFLDRQNGFDRQVAALFRTLHVRAVRQTDRLKMLEVKIAGYDEDLALFRTKLEDLSTALNRLQVGATDGKSR